MSKEELDENFIPNDEDHEVAPSENSGLFGLDVALPEAAVAIVPVPWEATVSYMGGTSKAPRAILKASHQLDLYDLDFGNCYQAGITMLEVDPQFPCCFSKNRGEINAKSRAVNRLVYRHAKLLIDKGKFVGVLGGDHSSPYGLVQALGEKYKSFGVLHVDAHHDLRKSYEGYHYSHASIIYNLRHDFKNISKIVSVGIRDFSEEEFKISNQRNSGVTTFYDVEIFDKSAAGQTFSELVNQIVAALPQFVYISFDIDGLDPAYCPGTGTPVPGGLSFNEAVYLISALGKSGKKVIGFDLCEVAPTENDRDWNANVGARILYKLCGAMIYSNKLLEELRV